MKVFTHLFLVFLAFTSSAHAQKVGINVSTDQIVIDSSIYHNAVILTQNTNGQYSNIDYDPSLRGSGINNNPSNFYAPSEAVFTQLINTDLQANTIVKTINQYLSSPEYAIAREMIHSADAGLGGPEDDGSYDLNFMINEYAQPVGINTITPPPHFSLDENQNLVPGTGIAEYTFRIGSYNHSAPDYFLDVNFYSSDPITEAYVLAKVQQAFISFPANYRVEKQKSSHSSTFGAPATGSSGKSTSRQTSSVETSCQPQQCRVNKRFDSGLPGQSAQVMGEISYADCNGVIHTQNTSWNDSDITAQSIDAIVSSLVNQNLCHL